MPTILVVDSEPNIAFLLKVILKARGYRVVTTVDHVEALRCLERTVFDLLVTDIHTPQVDGLKLLAECKHRWPALFIIVISIYASEGVKALEQGADLFILKPFGHNTLVSAVAELLGSAAE